MDSLLANYASSDDDERQQEIEEEEEEEEEEPWIPINNNNTHKPRTTPSSSSSSSSSSLSLFSSLPPPKSQSFSSLLPQAHSSSSLSNPPDPTPKRVVVQFKPPLLPTLPKPSSDSDDDNDDEAPKNPKRWRDSAADSSSVRSFLSSIPAPKNSSSSTLGMIPSASGSSRRSTIEYEAPPSDRPPEIVDHNVETYPAPEGNSAGYQQPRVDPYVDYSSYGGGTGLDYNAGDGSGGGYGAYYGENYGQIASGWTASSESVDVLEPVGNAVVVPGKRGRKDVPTEIVEVKQDDLTKDRPREDQVKLTGIAFGPSYQPVSSKGKPSKLHKRKHQIGSLFYDMKQKEMELAERRARGFLTKGQTQGKYGW